MAKDIPWFHAVIWPAMLHAAGVELPKQVYAHGFLLTKGEKMSKSKGNYIGVTDAPNDMFGKVMSISDAMMENYYTLLTDLPLDVHLMIADPDRYVEDFAKAGADWITVHVEACTHLHRTIQQIKSFGIKAGITLNPSTPLVTLEEVLAIFRETPRTCEYFYVVADGKTNEAVGVAATPDSIEFVNPGQSHPLLGEGATQAPQRLQCLGEGRG